MSGFLFAFLATLLAGFGARDQALLSQLTARQGRRPLLLLTALLATIGATVFAVWIAQRLLGTMAPPARMMFAAFALMLGGTEMLLLGPRKPIVEPTNSLFAALLVVGAVQITDAVRFLIVALGVATAAPVPAGLGGGLGNAAALIAGWAMPGLAQAAGWRAARRIAGAALLLIGLAIGARPFIA